MKLHRTTSEAVIEALYSIFSDNRYADKVIEKILKSNPKWGARDRRFIAETTYDIVRWKRYLAFISESSENDFWKLLATWCVVNNIELPSWQEFKNVNAATVQARTEKAKLIRKIRESVPDWLDEFGEKELGDRWEQELHAMNEEAAVVLRVNTLKTDKKELKKNLDEAGIATAPLINFPDALQLETRQNVFSSEAFQNGLFEVQDAASQLIAPFLGCEPGMRVIDACAGAGGKTLHLACLVKNKGRIIAMDVEPFKLDELAKRARRAGVSNAEIRLIESSKTIKRLEASADRLLLDVPCSGSGVLKRNPDAKWKLSEDFISKVIELQQHILTDYATIVKPGGRMVYSTCSVFPSENEMQVKKFVNSAGKNFKLIEEKHAWPSEGYDGFYMALLERVS